MSESQLLADLKLRVDAACLPYTFSDVTLLRFLRGRKLDVDVTLKSIVRHSKWRTDEAVATITPEDIRKEQDIGKLQVYGRDKNGRPVLYIFAKRHNKNDRDVAEMKKYIIYTLETALKNTNPEDERFTIIFDLSGFSLRCMDYEVLKLLIDILGYNYPETLQTAYVVYAPFLFWACWAIIKSWLDPVTAAKAQFVKETELFDIIEAAEIHPDFGSAEFRQQLPISSPIANDSLLVLPPPPPSTIEEISSTATSTTSDSI